MRKETSQADEQKVVDAVQQRKVGERNFVISYSCLAKAAVMPLSATRESELNRSSYKANCSSNQAHSLIMHT